MPAEPAFTVIRDGMKAELVPTLPTTTVLVVPVAGGTSGVT
jgi:hypothetical protein